jgi:TPR repeat protein
MGALLGGGHDVPVDRPAAQAWFEKAAAKNHPYAQLMLGRYLARGLAGETDPVRAREMLERARAAGIAEAAGDLAALSPTATVAPAVAVPVS